MRCKGHPFVYTPSPSCAGAAGTSPSSSHGKRSFTLWQRHKAPPVSRLLLSNFNRFAGLKFVILSIVPHQSRLSLWESWHGPCARPTPTGAVDWSKGCAIYCCRGSSGGRPLRVRWIGRKAAQFIAAAGRPQGRPLQGAVDQLRVLFSSVVPRQINDRPYIGVWKTGGADT